MALANASSESAIRYPAHKVGSGLELFGKVQKRFIPLAHGIGTRLEQEMFQSAMQHIEHVSVSCQCGHANCDHPVMHVIDYFCKVFMDLQSLIDTHAKTEKTLQAARDARNQQVERAERIEATLAQTRIRNQVLETAAAQHKRNRENDKEQRKVLKAERDELKTQLEAAQSSASSNEAELKELRAKVEEQATTIASLEELATAPPPPASIPPSLAAVIAERDDALQMAAEAETAFTADREALCENLTKANDELARQQSELESAQSRLEELDDHVIVLTTAKDAVVTELESANTRLDEVTSEAQSVVTALQAEKSDLQLKIDALEQSCEAARNEIDSLKSKLQSVRSDSHARITEQRDQLATSCANLNQELEEARKQYASQIKALEQSHVQAQSEIAELEELVTRPSDNSEELRRATEAKRTAEAKATRLQRDLDSLREAFEKTKANLEELNRSHTILQAEHLSIQETVKQRQAQIVGLETEIRNLQGNTEAKEVQFKQIKALEAQLEHEAERFKALEERSAKISLELECAKADLEKRQFANPLTEAKAVLDALESYKQNLESRLPSVSPASASTNSLDQNERQQLEQGIADREAHEIELNDISAEVYAAKEEWEVYCTKLELQLRVDELSDEEMQKVQSELVEAKDCIKSFDAYLEGQLLPMLDSVGKDLSTLRKRLELHITIANDDFLSILRKAIPSIPEPPLAEEGEADPNPEVDEDEVEAAPVSTSFAANAVAIADQLDISLQELLIVSLFDMLPNARKTSSFRRVVNSAIKAGIVRYYGTSNRELQKTWTNGHIEDRKIGGWLSYSGSVSNTSIYRRTAKALSWELNDLLPKKMQEDFETAYHSYAPKKNKAS